MRTNATTRVQVATMLAVGISAMPVAAQQYPSHPLRIIALALPDVRERLTAIGLEPVGNFTQEFTAHIKTDIAKWRKVIQDVNIKAE